MRSSMQTITAVLLSLATFFGSAGLSLHKMACLDSGKVAFSLEKDFCCAGDEDPSELPVFEAVCCEFDQLDFTVSDFDFNKSTSQAAAIIPSVEMTYIPVFSVCTKAPLYEELIPPLPHSERLTLLCRFII